MDIVLASRNKKKIAELQTLMSKIEDIKINNINTSDNVLIEIKEYTGGSN